MRIFALALSICLAAEGQTEGIVPPSGAWVTLSSEALHAGYDALWAIGDVHGRREVLEKLLLAARLAVPTDRGARIRWNPAKSRQLFVAVGDYIDGGEDSVGTVLLLRELQCDAEAAGSRVIVLLGNHEVAFLSDPEARARPELLRNASRSATRLGLQKGATAEQLSQSPFGAYLRSLPIAAFVGTWLFAHAGYLDAGTGREPLHAYFVQLARSLARRDNGSFGSLLAKRSITGYHRWWSKPNLLSEMKSRLDLLGLDGLVIGHDPDALGATGTIAMSGNGWLMKLDTGLKSGRSRGMLLHCPVLELIQRGGSSSAMARCGIMAEDGSLRAMIVR